MKVSGDAALASKPFKAVFQSKTRDPRVRPERQDEGETF